MLSPQEILNRLQGILDHGTPVGFDVEGQEWMTCCGFATSHTEAFVIDTLGLKGHPWGKAIWEALRMVLESPRVLKVCWNVQHERGFLQWSHGITLVNYADAMFKSYERWPELPKRLKYVASLLTRLPCWTEGISFKEEDEEAHATGPLLWRYNGHDCIATLQLWDHPQLQLPPRLQARYDLNLALVEPINYMSQKGVLYDQQAVETLRSQLTPQAWEAQGEVDRIAGLPLPRVIAHCRDHLCLKKRAGEITTLAAAERWAKKAYREPIQRTIQILGQGKLTLASQGEIGALLGTGLNVKSTKQVVATLNRLGLPKMFKPGSKKAAVDSEGDTAPSQSKDAETLLKLFLKTGHPITTAILKTVALRGRLQELNRGADRDGRIRCSFTIPGTETDRITSHKWLTGSGGNLQTVPREPVNFRVLYLADPGHLFAKVDLTGADLWTVAARVATLGDRTMLEDLLAGIRVPSLLGLILEHGYVPGTDRSKIKADCLAYRAELKRTGQKWKDTVWKVGGHATNYRGSPKTVQRTVIQDTYAETGTPIDPGLVLCAKVQSTYLSRYWGIPRWWNDVSGQVQRTGQLEMATGQVRQFLSRRTTAGPLDDETWREACAAEPQTVTTWVIKRTLLRLWQDPENWAPNPQGVGDPIVQPLLPIHDEADVQFLAERRPFAVRKLREWFTNSIRIGTVTVTIPFEGSTGRSWGECNDPL